MRPGQSGSAPRDRSWPAQPRSVSRAGLFEQLRHLVALVAREIVRAALGEVVVHVAVWIGPARPGRHAQVEILLPQHGDKARRIDLLNLDLEAGLVGLRLQDLGGAHLGGRVGDGDRDRHGAGDAGLRQQLLGGIGARLVGREFGIVGPADGGRDRTMGDIAGAEIDSTQHGLRVDRGHEGAPHRRIIEGRPGAVEREGVEADARRLLQRDVRLTRQAGPPPAPARRRRAEPCRNEGWRAARSRRGSGGTTSRSIEAGPRQ